MFNNYRRTTAVDFGDHHHRTGSGSLYHLAPLAPYFNTQVTGRDMEHGVFLQAVTADDFAFQRHALGALESGGHRWLRFFHHFLFRLFLLFLGLFRLAFRFGLLGGSQLLLAFLFQLLDQRKHGLLVPFEFFQGAALHGLVVLQRKEHFLLPAHLGHQALFFGILLVAQLGKLLQVANLLLFLFVAFPHEPEQGVHLFLVLIKQMMDPVNLPLRVPLLGQQTVQDFGFAAPAFFVQGPDAFTHDFLAFPDLPVQRIQVSGKLPHRPLHQDFALGKFLDVGPGLVQVLVQKGDGVEHALFFSFQQGQFLAFLGQVRLQFLEGRALFLNLGIGLFRRSEREPYQKTQDDGKNPHLIPAQNSSPSRTCEPSCS